jgi:hypothetical protein
MAWTYRGLRWFTPTRKPKSIAGTVRPYARTQASGMTAAQQNAVIGADMRSRYEKFGITDILPQRALDVQHVQLIPGRARMLENFAALERHPGNDRGDRRRHRGDGGRQETGQHPRVAVGHRLFDGRLLHRRGFPSPVLMVGLEVCWPCGTELHAARLSCSQCGPGTCADAPRLELCEVRHADQDHPPFIGGGRTSGRAANRISTPLSSITSRK